MKILGFSDLFWISLIAFALCLAFGLYMVITKKPGMVRSINDNGKYKDSKQYAERGGKLILALAPVCLLMLVVSFYNELISVLIGLAGMCVFGVFWKKMNDRFGPE